MPSHYGTKGMKGKKKKRQKRKAISRPWSP